MQLRINKKIKNVTKREEYHKTLIGKVAKKEYHNYVEKKQTRR